MWQALRNELFPLGFEIVTVGLDTLGDGGCRPFIEAAQPEHPSLIDRHHRVGELFGVINIPNGVWIDERGVIVRPAHAAPAPPYDRESPLAAADPPQRMLDIMAEAAQIETQPEAYHAALRDWVEHGAESRFALTPDEVVARSRPRDADRALGQAHFELACELEIRGDHAAAIEHYRSAHRLVPDNWTYRRQAWSLEPVGDGPAARFWQGPRPGAEDDWPYEGDWLSDIRESGPANYYEAWSP